MIARTNLPALLVTGLAMSTTAAFAEPAPKGAYVFTVTQAVMERCVGDADIVYGLLNSAIERHTALARRDIHRIVNTCSLRHRLARRAGLSFVALEALERDHCDSENCRSQNEKPLATETYVVSAAFTADYADLLQKRLTENCSSFPDVGCVSAALSATGAKVASMRPDWLETDSDGRVVSIEPVDVARYGTVPELPDKDDGNTSSVDLVVNLDSEISTILSVRDLLAAENPDGQPDGDLLVSSSEILKTEGYEISDTGLQISERIEGVEVSGVNGLLRFSIPADHDICVSLLSNADKLNAEEIAIGKDLWTQDSAPDAACPVAETDVRIVY